MWNSFTAHAAGTPQRNGVSEHRNRTLLDMVRSMMSLINLPLQFWGYALETAAFTLNRAPSKSNVATTYELCFGINIINMCITTIEIQQTIYIGCMTIEGFIRVNRTTIIL